MKHTPVLQNEVRQLFRDVQCSVQTIVDGTFGRGGHTRFLLNDWPDARVFAFDQDLEAIESGHLEFADEIKSGRLLLLHANFLSFADKVGKPIDIALLDLGVSSPQLDTPERGFSFYQEGPLDMRMDRGQGRSAAEVVNQLGEDELVDLFESYGEISRPRRVVRAIVNDRQKMPFSTTQQLAKMIERVEGWKKKGMHPATLYFMALRIYVNRELEVLQQTLPDLIRRLTPGGIIGVISFHSLEDRIVKQMFRADEKIGMAHPRRAIQASAEEIKQNPRSRSARLRGFLKVPMTPKNKYWQHSKLQQTEKTEEDTSE